MLLSGDHLLAGFHLGEQGLEPIGMLRPHHQIQFRHPAQQRFPLLLGDATSNHEREIGIAAFALRLAPQIAVDLLLCVVADRAGVVEHEVGIELCSGLAVAHGFQDPGHALGIGLVHLATEGRDPVAATAGAADRVTGAAIRGSGLRGRGGNDQGCQRCGRPEKEVLSSVSVTTGLCQFED